MYLEYPFINLFVFITFIFSLLKKKISFIIFQRELAKKEEN
jgi:hypothetical protein